MDQILVRDVLPEENAAGHVKTGDILPDGAVLLRRRDMDRMGLGGLRRWLMERAQESAVIAILDEGPPGLSRHRLEEGR